MGANAPLPSYHPPLPFPPDLQRIATIGIVSLHFCKAQGELVELFAKKKVLLYDSKDELKNGPIEDDSLVSVQYSDSIL